MALVTDDIDQETVVYVQLVNYYKTNSVSVYQRMERVVRERMSIQDTDSITPQQLINIRPVVASIKSSW